MLDDVLPEAKPHLGANLNVPATDAAVNYSGEAAGVPAGVNRFPQHWQDPNSDHFGSTFRTFLLSRAFEAALKDKIGAQKLGGVVWTAMVGGQHARLGGPDCA